jgi:hypothetical protein
MQKAGGCGSQQSSRAPSRQPHQERVMGFFSKILEKLGIGSTAAAPTGGILRFVVALAGAVLLISILGKLGIFRKT